MNVRITPLSSFSSRPDHNKISIKQSNYSRATTQKTRTTNNYPIASNKNVNHNQVPLKITLNLSQSPTTLMSKKGIVIYQQIERDKIFSEGVELTNRFSKKV